MRLDLSVIVIGLTLIFAPWLAVPAQAQSMPAAQPLTLEQRAAEERAAFEAAITVAARGPIEVKLDDQGKISLPADMLFIPQAQSARVLRALGNRVVGAGPLGLIMSGDKTADWMVVVSFVADGYIKDEDAQNWNAQELLDSIKEGTEQANADRRARGFPEREIIGWIEQPVYDATTHRLVWSLASKEKGNPATGDEGVNYNTYALGREGYFSLNLLTSEKSVEADKPVARQLLAALSFDDGKRYDQFNASTDKVAAYGLAALVGGAVAKKAGLFAVLFAFVAKFAKVFGIAAVAALAGLARFFRRGRGGG